MEVKDYCGGVEIELTVWKARLYDLLRRMNKMPASEKEKMHDSVEELHAMIADLTQRIEWLKTQCPIDWKPQKKEIDDKYIDMWTKYEKVIMKAMGKG